MTMEKKSVLNVMRWAAVIACTFVCMILLMAEPVTEEMSMKQWIVTFVAMKVGAIVCGAVAFGLAGKLKDIVDNFRMEE